MKRFFGVLLTLTFIVLITACRGSGGNESRLEWNIDGNTLKITGSGAIHKNGNEMPWSDRVSEIETLIVGYGITEIGDFVFDDLTELKYVALYEVEKIGDGAFPANMSIAVMYLPETIKHIGNNAFSAECINYDGTTETAQNLFAEHYEKNREIEIYGDSWTIGYGAQNGEVLSLTRQQIKAADVAIKKTKEKDYNLYKSPALVNATSISECDDYFAVYVDCCDVFLSPGYYGLYLIDKKNYDAELFDEGNGGTPKDKLFELEKMGFELGTINGGKVLKADIVSDTFYIQHLDYEPSKKEFNNFDGVYETYRYAVEELYKDNSYDVRYALFDIDDNGVPELIFNSDNWKYNVYSYYDNNIIYLGEIFAKYGITDYNSMFLVTNGGTGCIEYYQVELEGGQNIYQKELSYLSRISDANTTWYYQNEKEISEKEFMTIYNNINEVKMFPINDLSALSVLK